MLFLEAEKQISRWRGDGDAVGAVGGGDGVTGRRPAAGCREVCVLLQGVASRGRPGDDDTVAGMGDDEIWQARCLHDVDQTPEAAGHRITPSAHRAAGIGLADGAGDLVSRARARAAATGNFIPINGVSLGKGEGRNP